MLRSRGKSPRRAPHSASHNPHKNQNNKKKIFDELCFQAVENLLKYIGKPGLPQQKLKDAHRKPNKEETIKASPRRTSIGLLVSVS